MINRPDSALYPCASEGHAPAVRAPRRSMDAAPLMRRLAATVVGTGMALAGCVLLMLPGQPGLPDAMLVRLFVSLGVLGAGLVLLAVGGGGGRRSASVRLGHKDLFNFEQTL